MSSRLEKPVTVAGLLLGGAVFAVVAAGLKLRDLLGEFEHQVAGDADPLFDVRACRECGCTDDRACPGGCSWAGPELCSQCAHLWGPTWGL